MDIKCGRCQEPWDLYEINKMEPEEKKLFKSGNGCPSCKGHGRTEDALYAECLEIASIMMGDDIDGLACAMEDFNQIFG